MHRFNLELTKGAAGMAPFVMLSCRLPEEALRHVPANAPDYVSRHNIIVEDKPDHYRVGDAVTNVHADTVREALVEYLLASFRDNASRVGYCDVMYSTVLPRLALELDQASEEIVDLFAGERAV